jgi:ABC-type transport system substrate-binding protein
VRVVSDNNTRELELRSGGVDLSINSGFAPDTVSKMRSDADLQVVVAPGTNIAHLGLNTTDDVLKNVKVRQALAYAVNRDQIVNTVLQGQARPADAILPPESWAYEPGVTKYPFDPARAKQLLDEAGYPDADGDGPSARFTIEFVTSNAGIAPQIAQIVQEQWKAVGVGVNNTQFERTTFFERVNQGNYDAYFVISVGGNQTTDVFGWAYYANYWAPDRGELDAAAVRIRGAQDAGAVAGEMAAMVDILARRAYCPSSEVDRLVGEARTAATPDVKRQKLLAVYELLTARGAGNRMRYCNSALDDQILTAERAADREQQRGLYGQIQKTVSNEAPQIYLWYSANVLVGRKRVGNLAIDPSGAWYFLKDVTLA